MVSAGLRCSAEQCSLLGVLRNSIQVAAGSPNHPVHSKALLHTSVSRAQAQIVETAVAWLPNIPIMELVWAPSPHGGLTMADFSPSSKLL